MTEPMEPMETMETMETITSAADLLRAYAAGRRDFRAAYLRRADLRRAYLSDADLSDADLSDADLSDADLSDADLRRADLSDAYLRRADLRGAYLSDADLRGADLRGADLRDAYLSDADLRGADLRDAYLSDADLSGIRADVERICAAAPAEVPALLAALRSGQVDGSVYSGACACLVGTLAQAQGAGSTLVADIGRSSSPAERWAMAIEAGDTPETSQIVALTAGWVAAWLTTQGEQEGGGDGA